jgi:hypothetical protein
MANFVFNIALGQVVAYYRRIDENDPSTATMKILLLASSGIEADDTLNNADTISALVAGTTNESTNTGYARKSLTDADITAFSPDDTNNRVDLDIPDQTWTGVANDGTGAIGDLVTSYDPNASADTSIIPLTLHDFAVTPDGSDITAQVAAAGFYRAQ